MDDDARKERDIGPDEPYPYPVGVYPWNSSAPACTSTAFAQLANVWRYERLGAHRLKLMMWDGAEYTFDTETLTSEKSA
ncbi:hypothetical protein SDC9_155595 [bioreactor metagenome]|uniref:Uncharacterized protein n=1 Tax=bioreactor metagenome TaxID=1076179 RepID=A0A645F758_9ZZZZ